MPWAPSNRQIKESTRTLQGTPDGRERRALGPLASRPRLTFEDVQENRLLGPSLDLPSLPAFAPTHSYLASFVALRFSVTPTVV